MITATTEQAATSSRAAWHRVVIAGLAMLLVVGCEAPLDLTQVEAEGARDLRRYDMLQAAAHNNEQVAVVSSVGAVLVSQDSGVSWQRIELPGRPSLIDVTACATGDFFALDSERRVWHKSPDSSDWIASAVDTAESTLSIYCASNGRVWVSASFGTLFWSDVSLTQWNEFSLGEDLQLTAVRFVDELNGFAVGEFGTVLVSADGGDNWEMRDPIPNEFYPMAVDFIDARTGWVGGLDGVIWYTTDAGESWQRQGSVTKAPIYNIHAGQRGVYAVGGSAKLVEFTGGQWLTFEGAPEVLSYLRGLDVLENGALLVAGGGGTLAVIPLTDRRS